MLELLLSGLATTSLFWGYHGFIRRRKLEEWRHVATSCGLEVEKGSSIWGPRRLVLRARAGPQEVRFEARLDKKAGARIAVVVPGPPDFSGISIRREMHRLWRREIEVGDESFDDAFYVTGPVRLVRALLDEKARHQLIRANTQCEVSIASGELWAEVTDSQIRSFLPFFLNLGRRLAQPLDSEERLAHRLAHNARRDPEAGVRLQNLLLLVRELPEDAKTAAVLQAALTDASPLVRLRAAKELGDKGRDVLVALAISKGDDAVSAQAISALGRNLSLARARAILIPALDKRLTQTAHACLERLGHSRAAADFDALAKVMEREQGDLATVAALALGASRNMAAEPLLLQALLRDHRDLRVAAAKSLGRVGSVAAVLPLKEAAERASLNLDLRRATRQSIAEIQARLADASPGRLSLAGTEEGQLSLALADAGQLSIATDPAGQLSLSADGAVTTSASAAAAIGS